MILDFKDKPISLKPDVSGMKLNMLDCTLIVQEEMKLNIFSSSIFVFCDRK